MANTERDKFYYLLQLCQEQIRALEGDDFFAFDRIMAAKETLIATMTGARGALEADPSLQTIVARIQEYDRGAQKLLYRQVGKVMRELALIETGKKARAAYQAARRQGRMAFLPPNTPTFVDKHG